MDFAQRLRRRAAVLGVALGSLSALTLGACGGESSGPSSAKSCAELVDAAADVARSMTERYAGVAVDSLDAGTEQDPYPELTEPFAAFQERADELSCDAGELRRLACDAYQGLTSTGPAVEEMLTALRERCS